MALREKIIFHAKVSVHTRINESLKAIKPCAPAFAKDAELLRQLGMPEMSAYKTGDSCVQCRPPRAERACEFLRQKRDELWQAERL